MKFKILFSILILCSFASAVTSSYDITVDEGGRALAVLVLTGEGTVNIPLPLDAGSPVVEGGIYVMAENGIDITITDTTSLIYKSDLLTLDQDGVWVFDLELPEGTSSVTLSLPLGASITETIPAAAMTSTQDSKNLLWTNAQGIVTVTYTMSTVVSEPIQQDADYTMVILLLIIAIVVLFLLILKKKPRKAGQ